MPEAGNSADRPASPPSLDPDRTAGSDADLVPDSVEEAADAVRDSARALGTRASLRARAAATVTGRVKGQATGQLIELGDAARHDDLRHWRALAACILAIVSTAIDPPILQATSSGVQGALRVEPETAAQLVGLYYIIQAGMMVFGGVLGDRFGMRRVLVLGMIGTLVSALVMSTAATLPVLLVGSVGLSIFSAAVIPLSLAGVMRTFGQRVLPVAIALYLSIQLLAALLSPALAQLLFDFAGLAATFVPTIAVTIAAIFAVRRWLPESKAAERMGWVDIMTLTIWSVGMLALVYGTVAFAGGWGSGHQAALLIGIVFLLGAMSRFARGTARIRPPNVEFRIIGLALFLGATLALAQSGTLLQLSTFLKGVQGYGAVASGVALAPFAIGTLIASIATGVALARQYRGDTIELRFFRRPVAFGFVLISLSALLMSLLEEDSTYLIIGIALGLLGVGASIANVPRTNLLFRSVRQDRIGVASGLNGSSFLLGEALGNVAVTAIIAIASAATWQQQLVDSGMSSAQAAEAYETAQRAVFLATSHPYLQPSYLDVASQVPSWSAVFTSGFTTAMLGLAVIAVLAAAVAFLGLRGAPDA